LSSSKLRFVGGGRWAQIVLGELVKLNPKIDIDWVTSYSSNKQNLINKFSKFDKNIKIFEIKDIQTLNTPEKVIIVSHSINHCRDFLIHNNSVPTLIEKPLFPVLNSFLNLSIKEKNRIFFNLEFKNAFFIKDFCSKVNFEKIYKLEFEWHDPIEESRDDSEKKYSEVFSSIFMDQLFHVMSILKAMGINSASLRDLKIFYEANNSSGEVYIQCESNNFQITISLSRFSQKRKRKITINDNLISLDFGSKPVICKNGNFHNEIQSKNRIFPIAKTLESFLTLSKDSLIQELSLNSLEAEIEFCFKCESLYIDNFQNNSLVFTNQFNPFLTYLAGIYYYQKNSHLENISPNFYLKGPEGIKELIKWWKKHQIEIN
jgi:hypothetical protein